MKINKSFLAPFYPFAGIAVAWYCFMPNIELLTCTGMYRSQLLIHANFVAKDLRYFWRSVTQPKKTKWDKCRYKYLMENNEKWIEFNKKNIPLGSERINNKEYQDLIKIDLKSYINSKCGSTPEELPSEY